MSTPSLPAQTSQATDHGLDTWRQLHIDQQPTWSEHEDFESTIAELNSVPPLVFAGEVDAMRQAHRHLADLLTTLATLTDGFTPPDEAPADWRALYVGARSLKEDLMEHLYLENQVLFERR